MKAATWPGALASQVVLICTFQMAVWPVVKPDDDLRAARTQVRRANFVDEILDGISNSLSVLYRTGWLSQTMCSVLVTLRRQVRADRSFASSQPGVGFDEADGEVTSDAPRSYGS